jgi:hypothetical protein
MGLLTSYFWYDEEAVAGAQIARMGAKETLNCRTST